MPKDRNRDAPAAPPDDYIEGAAGGVRGGGGGGGGGVGAGAAPTTDPWADAPRWMRPGADRNSEMSENMAFLGGRMPGQRERERDSASRRSSDDSLNRMFRDFDVRSEDGDSRNMSEQHSPLPGARHDEAEEVAFDEDDKEERRERGIQFRPAPLPLSALINGDTLRTTAEGRRIINEPPPPAAEAAGGENVQSAYTRLRRLLASAEAGVAYDMPSGRQRRPEGGGSAADLPPHLRPHASCQLCRHATVRPEDANPEFHNAYEAMKRLDSEKGGYASEAQIYIDMAVVFNAHQEEIEKAGGEACRVDPETVKIHFRYHDICSPVRFYSRQVRILDEIVDMLAARVCGSSDRGKFVSMASLNALMRSQTQLKHFYDAFIVMRSYTNVNPNTLLMAGPRGALKRKPSRHLAGAPQPGKFTGEYMK